MFRAYGLYSHIRANRIRTVLLLLGFVVLLHALAFSLALLYEAARGGAFDQILTAAAADMVVAWPYAVAAALAWFAIAYLGHQALIDLATGAHGIERQAEPRLHNILENLCISRGVPMPALQVMETEALNAYASGLREGRYSVTVTRGLLDALDDAELEAVLGHELTHIRNRDTQVLVIAVIFAGIFSFVGDLVLRNWNFNFVSGLPRGRSRDDDRKDGGGAMLAVLLALAIIALSWGSSMLLRFALSRTREFLADAGSVELTKNPDAMIGALRKIEGHAAIAGMPSRVSAFFIEDPERAGTGLMDTHPSIADRIAALVQFAGGHDVLPMAEPRRIGPWGRR
jgi:heat shock protein HtpX